MRNKNAEASRQPKEASNSTEERHRRHTAGKTTSREQHRHTAENHKHTGTQSLKNAA